MATAKLEDTITDFQKIYDYAQQQSSTFQLWGRTPKIEIVTASGADETAQRADALEVINMKPFMVVDLTGTSTAGAPVFSSAVAAKKILVVQLVDHRDSRPSSRARTAGTTAPTTTPVCPSPPRSWGSRWRAGRPSGPATRR